MVLRKRDEQKREPNMQKRLIVVSLLLTFLVYATAILPGCGEDNETSNINTVLKLRVMTYNVLCSFCDKRNFDPWEERIHYFADIVNRHDPDLIGFQELLYGSEVEDIANLLNDKYAYIYFHDPEGPIFEDYADATIFYKKDKFEVVTHGFYWLSETPDEPWSPGWTNMQFWRLVNWAEMRTLGENSTTFYFATTHFDNNSPNQEMSAPLVVERSRTWAEKMPVILVGDFNSRPDSKAYGILTKELFTDSFDIAKEWTIDTNQNPIPEYDTSNRIDHIFLSGKLNEWIVPKWTVDMHTYGEKDRYPSDHFPIVANVEMHL